MTPDCRLCGKTLDRTFVDLGMSPPCESFLSFDELEQGETFYPLHVRVCDSCLLVQLPAYLRAEAIFEDYAYFSSYSESWVRHARDFVQTAIHRLELTAQSFIVEVASNDGYLLQHVVAAGIRCLGIEPAANVASAAVERGIPTEVCFLGEQTGWEVRAAHGPADLVCANNVLAHVPDIVDFAKGLRALVGDAGLVSIEIPHLLRLIQGNEFDTIYHEHFSYLSLLTTVRVLATAGLTVVDVEELSTHGGSLRTWSAPAECAGPPSGRVRQLLEAEEAAGLHTAPGHDGFANRVARVRNDFVEYLIGKSREGLTVAAYGAPGKGNTLLNYCGIRKDLISFTVDRNPGKHGKFLPGTHIPIYPVTELAIRRPDIIVILPWNLRAEITRQLAFTAQWGAKLAVPLPSVEEFSP